MYDTDVQSVRQFLIQAGRISPSDVVNDGTSTITADRKDYYLALLLLDGLISSDNTYMPEPSTIKVSGSEQKAIDLINPLTGLPEKI